MNAVSIEQEKDYQVVTCSIRTITDMHDFEKQFFDLKDCDYFKKKIWKDFNYALVPQQMTEIVQICNGKFKKTRTFEIDLRNREDRSFLCFLIYFTRGKTSATYNKTPFSFIIQPKENKEKVLSTILRIKVPKERELNIIGGPTKLWEND